MVSSAVKVVSILITYLNDGTTEIEYFIYDGFKTMKLNQRIFDDFFRIKKIKEVDDILWFCTFALTCWYFDLPIQLLSIIWVWNSSDSDQFNHFIAFTKTLLTSRMLQQMAVLPSSMEIMADMDDFHFVCHAHVLNCTGIANLG
ncbi:unnamed protein product [Enterobius vermicularis]|uniref:Innexin n=1 Tax=Enterobius vermicularis TaxID=51028 RepID=A0A0N4UVR5_ENTVE|nr:unnamed protein product [Enterobius vermicularis]